MLMYVILLALPTFISAGTVPDAPAWAVVPDKYIEGMNVTLTCTSTRASKFTLYKNHTLLSNSSTAVITLSPYKSSDDYAIYTCIGVNTDGNSTTNTTQVIKTHILKPTLKVTKPAASAAYTDGDNVTITCHTITTGTVTYSFTKDGAAAPGHVDAAVGNNRFTPYSAATHAGTYKCKAIKDSLEVESEALVVGNSAVQMMTSTIILSMCLLVASVIY